MKESETVTIRTGLFWVALLPLPAFGASIDVTLPAPAASALLAPAGDVIAIGHTDGRISLLSADDGHLCNQWPTAGNQVEHLDFSADGRRLLTVSPDRVIRVLATDKPAGEVIRWQFPEYFAGAGISPDGRHVLIVAYNAPLRWCDTASGAVVREWRDPAQPHGYSIAQVLDDAGLAVVSPLRGETVLVDAAQGRVVARLGADAGAGGSMPAEADDVVMRNELETMVWSRAALLRAGAAKEPPATIAGRRITSGGPVGAAAGALPAEQWVFWRRQAHPGRFAWAEPTWDRVQSAGGRGPVVIDPARHRVWWQFPGGHWQGWDWSELGPPDALTIGAFASAPELVGDTLASVRNPNNVVLCFDWRDLAPVYAELPAVRFSPPVLPTEMCLAVQLTASGVRGAWWATWDNSGSDWVLAWRGATTEPGGAPVATGFGGQAPRVKLSPQGLCAVFSSTPGWKTIGPRPSVGPSVLGGDATTIVVPAVQIWDPGTGRPLPRAFEDHRSVGVVDVRWSRNGRWLATRDYDPIDGRGSLRVFSVDNGRRVVAPQRGGRFGDFAAGDDGALVWSDEDGIIRWCAPGGVPRELCPAQAATRSAKVAIAPAGDSIALLTEANQVLLLRVTDGAVVRSWKVPGRPDVISQPPSGGLAFADASTLIIVAGADGWIRKLNL